MPRVATITQADVTAICDRLIATGVSPSVRRIIDEHGSGAQGTVYPLFRAWQGGHAQPNATVPALSPVLQRSLLDFVNREIAQAKLALEEKLVEGEHIARDLARENERQATELGEQADAHAKLVDGLAGLQGRVAQLEADLNVAYDATQRERANAEKARTELAVALLRLEAIPQADAELAASRQELCAERRRRVDAEQMSAVSVAQREGMAERLTEEKARSEELSAQLLKEQQTARSASADLAESRVAIEGARARLEAADRELRDARLAVDNAQARERVAIEAAAELRGQRPSPDKFSAALPQ